MSLTTIIRTAIQNNTVRNFQIEAIAHDAGCSRHVAKQLYFSFLYHVSEDYLQDLLKGGEQ